MDLNQFEHELRQELSRISYVRNIEIKPRTAISMQGKATLPGSYVLHVFFNETFFILSFSLVFKHKRIWAIDRDNRIGWHIHPLDNPNSHLPTNEKTIHQIIAIFDEVCKERGIHKT